MNYLESQERQQLITPVLTATTLPKIITATDALKGWVEEHPDDLGIIDGFEQLSLMEDCAREREAENAASVSMLPSTAEPATVG